MQQQQAAAAQNAGQNANKLAAEQAKRRCDFYENMGCCAPMVIGVGYRASTAVEDIMVRLCKAAKSSLSIALKGAWFNPWT
jgi:hypothetical protein